MGHPKTLTPEKVENETIRNLWYRMSDETQRALLSVCMVEFRISSSTYVKQTWMQKGKVPKELLQKLEDIMMELLEKQMEQTKLEIVKIRQARIAA